LSLTLDLKHAKGVHVLLKILSQADVLLDPYRPGVLEGLGLGPEIVCKKNPQLIYARLTGYGQSG